MLIMPRFQEILIVELFQGNYLKVLFQCRDPMRLHNPIPEMNANPFPLPGGRVYNSSAKFR